MHLDVIFRRYQTPALLREPFIDEGVQNLQYLLLVQTSRKFPKDIGIAFI